MEWLPGADEDGRLLVTRRRRRQIRGDPSGAYSEDLMGVPLLFHPLQQIRIAIENLHDAASATGYFMLMEGPNLCGSDGAVKRVRGAAGPPTMAPEPRPAQPPRR